MAEEQNKETVEKTKVEPTDDANKAEEVAEGKIEKNERSGLENLKSS